MGNTNKQVVRSCSNCRYAVFQDYGFSSYTVEGSTFRCAKKVHPLGDDIESTFDDDPWTKQAESCREFSNGLAIWLDVDGETESLLSEEELAILDLAWPKR